MTVRESIRKAMTDEMRMDDKVFLMGEEVGQYQGAYKVSKGMYDEFGPGRVWDTPITEAGFTGIGVGAGMGGLKPIIEFMTTCPSRVGDTTKCRRVFPNGSFQLIDPVSIVISHASR